nr:helix-turn-helix domain-containing protein [Sneathiella limimaris]
MFAALGDPVRIHLVDKLSDGQGHSITELVEGFKMSRQAVRKHLQALELAKLVKSLKLGREQHFHLMRDKFTEAQEYFIEVSRQWDENLDRLKRYVDE